MFRILTTWIAILVFMLESSNASNFYNGYHYPTPSTRTLSEGGHFFSPISTIAPLPSTPDVLALSTKRPYLPHSLRGPIKVQPDSRIYLPQSSPKPSISRIAQEYLPPNKEHSFSHDQQTGIISTASYLTNTRPLKQYAVVEIVDNDIEQPSKPFLNADFFNPFRARLGASGIGATAFSGGIENQQMRAHALLLEQNRIMQQLVPQAAAGDVINLGSGGLGYIRLPNGNVYLGSGSLGYISGQEHTQSVLEARTRSESSSPNALHFGHGPQYRDNRFIPFK